MPAGVTDPALPPVPGPVAATSGRSLGRVALLAKSMLAGAVATASDLGTFMLLAHVVGVPARWANMAGLVVGAVINFVGNRHFAFRAQRGSVTRQAQWYVAVTVVALGLNAALFHFAVDWLPTWPSWLVRLIVSNGIYLAFIFPMFKRRVFRAD